MGQVLGEGSRLSTPSRGHTIDELRRVHARVVQLDDPDIRRRGLVGRLDLRAARRREAELLHLLGFSSYAAFRIAFPETRARDDDGGAMIDLVGEEAGEATPPLAGARTGGAERLLPTTTAAEASVDALALDVAAVLERLEAVAAARRAQSCTEHVDRHTH